MRKTNVLRRTFFLNIAAVLFVCGFGLASSVHAGVFDPECLDAKYSKPLKEVWESEKVQLRKDVKQGLEKTVPTAMYFLEVFTDNLIALAAACRDLTVISEIAELYVIPFEYLQEKDGYKKWLLKNGEEFERLSLSQFLYGYSALVNFISINVPAEQRTEPMKKLISYAGTVFRDQYMRWIFGEPVFHLTGWRCRGAKGAADRFKKEHLFNHYAFVKMRHHRLMRSTPKEKKFCDAANDVDLWILSGSLELVTSGQFFTDEFTKESKVKESDYREYVKTVVAFLQSRLEGTTVQNFEGKKVPGIIFDPGAYSDHNDLQYAGYEGETYPTKKNRKKVAKVTWDVSHTHRFVPVLRSLRRHADWTGDFPSVAMLNQWANQFAYSVFNGDFNKPLFSNYMNANGWYRVGYRGRKGFGYAPFKLSTNAVNGGYGFWSAINPDIRKIYESVWNLLQSDSELAKKTKGKYFKALADRTPKHMLRFLPAFAKVSTYDLTDSATPNLN